MKRREKIDVDPLSVGIPVGIVPQRVHDRVDALIRDIDRRVAAQLDTILHHPEFRALERVWRSAWLVVDQLEVGGNVRLQILHCTKRELQIDFEDSPDVFSSSLYHLVGDHTMDDGAFPMAAFIGDYEFGPGAADIRLLRSCGAIGSVTHAPFIAGAAAELFGHERFRDVCVGAWLRPHFESPEMKRWMKFRESEDSRYMALTVPRMLLRPHHDADLADGLRYREQIARDDERLWGNASFALATRIMESFQFYGWSPNIIGPRSGGMMKGLAARPYTLDSGTEIHISTDRAFTEMAEYILSEEGFVPLTCSAKQPAACFYSANSTQRPKYFGQTEEGRDAELNYRLGTQLPYLFITNRIADYLKFIHKQHMGSWADRFEIERELNRWAGTLVAGRCVIEAADRANRMLRKIQINVEDMEDDRGWYKLELKLRPFFKYMGAFFTLGAIGKLDKH